jgi:hypothetical protein
MARYKGCYSEHEGGDTNAMCWACGGRGNHGECVGCGRRGHHGECVGCVVGGATMASVLGV